MNKDLKNAFADLGTIAADSLSGALTLGLVPVGSLVRAGREAYSAYRAYHLEKKLNKFLETIQTDDITSEDIEEFIESLEDKKEEVSNYMQGLLINAECEEKAKLMAYIYKAAVRKEIDYKKMLKLCSIVETSFVYDLKDLPLYENENEELIEESNYLTNLGLIDNYVGGIWSDTQSVQLNSTGLLLLDILRKENWF